MLTQAVILAGGLGTRLGELTRKTPKPLLDVAGVPFMDYLIFNLKRHGIDNVLLSVGYLSEQIANHYGDGTRFGVNIDYVIEQEPAGTGGALLHAEPKLDEQFLLLNGDTIFDFNYLDLALHAQEESVLATLALRTVDDVARYGEVTLENNRITEFVEKGSHRPGLINGGVYVISRKILQHIHNIPCSLESDVFTRLVKDGALRGKAYNGFFLDIGLKETLSEANRLLPEWKRKPAIFMDRDGVINVDNDYVHTPAEFSWVNGAREAIKFINDLGYLVIVITNQAGIARGYYSEQDFVEFMDWINKELMNVGAHIDGYYYCPHHPVEGQGKYNRNCDCRKPEPGMIIQALEEWSIDTEKSMLVGDKESDLQAGKAVGIQGFLFSNPDEDLLEFISNKIELVTG